MTETITLSKKSKSSSHSSIYYATGRRKRSSARVYFTPGTHLSNGEILITVNNRPLKEYFGRATDILKIKQSITLAKLAVGSFTIMVKGGGTTGQAGAIALGITRALVDSDVGLRSVMKTEGLMTRDSRMVEQKKYGYRKARKVKQYSKR